MKQLGLGIIVAIGLTLPAFGQQTPAPPTGPLIMPDPLIGSWKLNLAKSMSNTPLPKSMILAFAGEGQNFINTATGDNDQGPFRVVLRHIYDGMPHPTTGAAYYDSTAFTRVGNTINGVRLKEGKPVEVFQVVIVPGETYTVTYEGIANNQPFHGVRVFDRQ
jgi:hypothetical protein